MSSEKVNTIQTLQLYKTKSKRISTVFQQITAEYLGITTDFFVNQISIFTS